MAENPTTPDNAAGDSAAHPAPSKPELITLHGSQVTVETLEKLVLRLTGKPMSPECRVRAEKVAAKYQAVYPKPE